MTKRFDVGDLVQIKSEYEEHGNPSFRIREITGGQARIGQLSSQYDGFIGTDTWIDLDDPELIRPRREILRRYARCYNQTATKTPRSATCMSPTRNRRPVLSPLCPQQNRPTSP